MDRIAPGLPRRLARLGLALVACALLCGGPLAASEGRRHDRPGRTRAIGDRYDLARDEALGGHTLARHVGRSDAELRERLRRDRHIAAASTYSDRESAERVVADTLARERARVERWEARRGARPNLVLDFHGDPRRPIGRCLRRGQRGVRPAWDAVVVLRWREDVGFFVLTTYPEA